MLHDFSGGADGGVPFSSVIQASDGDFYGTTVAGGDPSCSVYASNEDYSTYIGCGTVFKMDLAGNLSALYSFTGSPSDGSNSFSTLLEGSDGFFLRDDTLGWNGFNLPLHDQRRLRYCFRGLGTGRPAHSTNCASNQTPWAALTNRCHSCSAKDNHFQGPDKACPFRSEGWPRCQSAAESAMNTRQGNPLRSWKCGPSRRGRRKLCAHWTSRTRGHSGTGRFEGTDQKNGFHGPPQVRLSCSWCGCRSCLCDPRPPIRAAVQVW